MIMYHIQIKKLKKREPNCFVLQQNTRNCYFSHIFKKPTSKFGPELFFVFVNMAVTFKGFSIMIFLKIQSCISAWGINTGYAVFLKKGPPPYLFWHKSKNRYIYSIRIIVGFCQLPYLKLRAHIEPCHYFLTSKR